jgi:SNF2 family DNA or RNA helicase
MSFVEAIATQFVSEVINTAVQNITHVSNRFGLLLEKANFTLNKHQLEGVLFCVRNETKMGCGHSLGLNVKGGIIADEMGLGKTLLMIGTMFSNFLKKTIIVVPPILIQQWANENYKCSGHRALIYHGTNKKNTSFAKLSDKKVCIVLTTYNTLMPLRKDKKGEEKGCDLLRIQWDRAIFDEAHHLRNSRTRRFYWAKQIMAPIRWLISGTPIQNRRSDFYSLCNMLGFAKLNKDSNVRYIMDNYVLRRTKAQVGIQLPPVNKNNVIVPWKNVGEKLMSEEIHSLISKQSGVEFNKGKDVASAIMRNINNPRAVLLIAMLRAKQSCILPSLMKKSPGISSCIMSDKTGGYLDAVLSSSKMDAVVNTILERKDNGKGKIVFCNFIDEIDTIAKRLRDGGIEKVVIYDGRTTGKKRIFDKADVIVLQIQTGCEGLNLQEFFSEVYFVSPHWNPAIEDQAIARCHRIGQKVDVDVFKFEMDGFGIENSLYSDSDSDKKRESVTLDKYVNCVQTVKRDIANSIL